MLLTTPGRAVLGIPDGTERPWLDRRVDTTLATDIDVRRLAELDAPERAFVSYYFSGEDSLGTLAHRAERVRALLRGQPAELEHFDESVALIERWLEDHHPHGAGCVFACWALDLCEGYQLDLPLPDYLHLGAAPYIRPIAVLKDEYETFALVAADNDGSQIYLVTSGEPELLRRVSGGVKSHVKKGGWSQKRYQNRRQNQLLHYAREVATALGALAREEDFDRVVLVGSNQTMEAIIRELPAEVAGKQIRKKGIDLHEGDDHTLAEAFELFIEEERAAERRLWDRIREEYLTGGLAAVGATDVLKAAQVGRVDSIAITRDTRIRGTKCRECENVVHGTPNRCQICGSGSVFTVELVDELTRLAEKTSAEVDFVDPIEELSELGEVAALLRY